MNLESLFLAQAAAFSLSACRVGGYVLASPFPGNHVGATQRVGLVVVLAVMVCTSLPVASQAPHDVDARLLVGVASELGCGLLIGFAFRLVLSAADVLGQTVSQATGLGMPSVLNPTIEANDAVLGRIVALMAMLVALGAGVHRVALEYLLASFRAIPLGSPIAAFTATPAMVDMAGAAIATGVRLAMPVVAVGLVVQVTLALLSRAAPSMQVFSVGMAVLVVAGVATLVASLDDVAAGLLTHLSSLGGHIDQILTTAAEQR